MLTEILAEFERGMNYGIDRSIAVMTRDRRFNQEPPDCKSRAFKAGEWYGKIGGGAITLWFIDIGSLGVIPLYNHFKYRDKQH